MRIAVIGLGTAGAMAAVFLTKVFPEHDLTVVWDPDAPPIGVGEGTTAIFPPWLHSMTGLSFPDLQERYDGTLKYGILFEGWGTRTEYFHPFYPVGRFAYHISADLLGEELRKHIDARFISRRVVRIAQTPNGASVTFADGSRSDFDIVVDARGFPNTGDEISVDWIPTDSAMIRRVPVVYEQNYTRAIARPHGWVFVIPLTTRTSYGYVFSSSHAESAEVARDFDELFAVEGVESFADVGVLRFPNFISGTMVDGAVFAIGNRASFLEPLEATSIAVLITQLRALGRYVNLRSATSVSDDVTLRATAGLNAEMALTIERLSLFVGWHYSMGSRYSTPFWRHARASIASAVDGQRPRGAAATNTFWSFVEAGREVDTSRLWSPPHSDDFEQCVGRYLNDSEKFGGFTVASFAQVGDGIGFYDVVRPGRRQVPVV